MRPDYSRNVRCVLGLPFDVIDEAGAEQRLRNAIATGTRCFLSTPNLNFAVACQTDDAFRQSVLESDLSVADGWPIVTVARLTGAALPERVAGSSLFERVARSAQRPPVKVYFFGGPPGAAAAASRRLNGTPAGVVSVGDASPGFGSVAEMSTEPVIDRINAAVPDWVVVALGAKKGQDWIRHNSDRLDAPVVAHLGAVVNFVAGTVSRAPGWLQAMHLEWLWRIREEPSLWRRYFNDGSTLLKLLLVQVLPFALDQWIGRQSARSLQTPVARLAAGGSGATTLTLSGAWTASSAPQLAGALSIAYENGAALIVDLGGVTHIDSAALGMLALARGAQVRAGRRWRVDGVSPHAARSMRLAGANYLVEAA